MKKLNKTPKGKEDKVKKTCNNCVLKKQAGAQGEAISPAGW